MGETNAIEKHDEDFAAYTSRQSVSKARLGGLAGMFGTVLFCLIVTDLTGFTFGFFKVVFGVIVGYAVKAWGKGSGHAFGFIAGIHALSGVVLFEVALSAWYDA